MILSSKTIKIKAERFRRQLSEAEALIAEGMIKDQPFEDMSKAFGITRAEFELACRDSLVNLYFWSLVALQSTQQLEAIGSLSESNSIGGNTKPASGPTMH